MNNVKDISKKNGDVKIKDKEDLKLKFESKINEI